MLKDQIMCIIEKKAGIEAFIYFFYQNHRISEPYYPPLTERTAFPRLQRVSSLKILVHYIRDMAQKPKPKYVANICS